MINYSSIDEIVKNTPHKITTEQSISNKYEINYKEPNQAILGVTTVLLTFVALKYIMKKDITFNQIKKSTSNNVRKIYDNCKNYLSK